MRFNRIEKLIVRSGAGDRAAFEALYDKTAPKLYAVTLHILKNKTLAEDTLQDVYAKIWTLSREYKSDGRDAMLWLIALTRDTAIGRLRQEKGRLADMSALQDRPVVPHSPVVKGASIATETKRMPRCVEALEKEKAAAMRGTYLEGASYADLALRFDIPLADIRNWFGETLLELKKSLRS
ncbi:MAG: sigma factor [Roseobacter sp.]